MQNACAFARLAGPRLQSKKNRAFFRGVAPQGATEKYHVKRFILFFVVLGLLCTGALPASALFGTSSAAKADRLITVREIASKLNLNVSQPAKKIILSNQTNTVELSTEGREVRVNGQLVWLNAPPSRSWGRWCLTETDAQKIVLPLLSPASYLKGYGTAIVVLDPGHGGQDPGATSARGLVEPRIALDIAKRVRAKLIAEGFHAYLTRDMGISNRQLMVMKK